MARNRWPYRKIRSLNKKKVSLEQSVKTFYKQYHKMKSQLDQVNKERKDILLKETGWDSLADEEQEDHPAFHDLEYKGKDIDPGGNDESDDDFEETFEDEDDSQESLEEKDTPLPSSAPKLNPPPTSPKRADPVPFTTSMWSAYAQATQPIIKETTTTPQQIFRIPSINDLLAGVDSQARTPTFLQPLPPIHGMTPRLNIYNGPPQQQTTSSNKSSQPF
jgi:hypothetical protein